LLTSLGIDLQQYFVLYACPCLSDRINATIDVESQAMVGGTDDTVYFATLFVLLLLKGFFGGIFTVAILSIFTTITRPHAVVALVYFVLTTFFAALIGPCFTTWLT